MENNLTKEIEQQVKQLANETDNFKKSDFFKKYLDIASKFWKYSFRNQMLIKNQYPDASRVAGFRIWNKLGRHVMKGSHAIKILAPIIKKTEDDEVISYFKAVNVFDVSQTDGKELPKIEIELKGDDFKPFIDKLKKYCEIKSIEVDFKALGVNGLYGYSQGGKIAIDDTHSINTQVSTMIHEIAHEILHKGSTLSKSCKEIQAEGTAYVVMKHFGVESKSFNYLALYDTDYKKIIENLDMISNSSKEIIQYLEAKTPL